MQVQIKTFEMSDEVDKNGRQLNLRTRKRVKRPPIITPSSASTEEDDEEFTLSRGSAFNTRGSAFSARGSSAIIDDDEPEVPR